MPMHVLSLISGQCSSQIIERYGEAKSDIGVYMRETKMCEKGFFGSRRHNLSFAIMGVKMMILKKKGCFFLFVLKSGKFMGSKLM